MATNTAKSVKVFWAAMPSDTKHFLGTIRHWSNIQLANDDGIIWLKGFTAEQAESAGLKQIPNLVLYEWRDGYLFKKDALVPSTKMRTALLWSLIDKALRLAIPNFNHNYFGIHEKVEVHLVPSDNEQEATALYVKMNAIESLIANTTKYKLDLLQWVVIDDMALILGTPLLGFPGQTFWQQNGHLIPSGFDFEFNSLSLLLQQRYNIDNDDFLLWNKEGQFTSIPKSAIMDLSLSSFRLTKI